MKRLAYLLLAPLLLAGPLFGTSHVYRAENKPYFYSKIGGGVVSEHDDDEGAVAGGLGFRRHHGASYGWDLGVGGLVGDEADNAFVYGRGLGLLYLAPRSNFSPYIGAGLGLGARSARRNGPVDGTWHTQRTGGLFGEFAIGIEWIYRRQLYCATSKSSDGSCTETVISTAPFLFFLELSIHQPTIVHHSGGRDYSPSGAIEFGFGF